MSIQTAITAAQQRVADCYTAISAKGGTLPATQNLANMPTAIGSISTGGTINSLSITPKTSQQTITASGGVDGYSPITVSAVTSNIDSNIQAGNIKNGVSILGVAGTLQSEKYGATINNFLGNINSSGVLQPPTLTSGNIVFSGVKDVAQYGLYYRFAYGMYQSSGNFSVSFPDLINLTKGASCGYCFYNCPRLSYFSAPLLKTISGSSACSYMFYSCSQMTGFDLSSLEEISNTQGAAYMFYGCNNASFKNITLPSLKTISGESALSHCFDYAWRMETITFPQLTTISGASAFSGCFHGDQYLSSISFPSVSTIESTAFATMFNSSTAHRITSCKVHFPSNMQTVVSGLSGYPLFGGSSGKIVLAFDL